MVIGLRLKDDCARVFLVDYAGVCGMVGFHLAAIAFSNRPFICDEKDTA